MGNILFSILLLIPLVCGAFTDYRHRIIPNWVCVVIFFIGLLSMAFLPHDSSFFIPFCIRMAGVSPAVLMLLIAYFKGGIGGGDIKLMAVLGFTIGYYALIPVLFVTAIAAVIWAKIHKEKSVPLASFLLVGVLTNLAICITAT